jgi:predicted TIM-barrel fold metal-dependent hydrolase
LAAAGLFCLSEARVWERPLRIQGIRNTHEKVEKVMQIIGLEEHFTTPEIVQAQQNLPPDQQDDSQMMSQSETLKSRLLDLGDERLRQMDDIGLDRMVISVTTPATQILPPSAAVPLAKQANDRLAAAVKAHPDRFSGFATLPTSDPAASVLELERCIQDLGFVGAMINGRSGDKYLDHPDYRPLLQKAADLGYPIYVHPQIAPRAVRAYYYDGFDEKLSAGFASSGLGWHIEAGITGLRLILAGVFDEIPHLQIILGHWGETITFYLERINKLSMFTDSLKRPVADYFRSNFYVTGSGIYHTPYLLECIRVLGVGRVMYSTDYPFEYSNGGIGKNFLEEAPISYDDKMKIAHINAEQLLKLKAPPMELA